MSSHPYWKISKFRYVRLTVKTFKMESTLYTIKLVVVLAMAFMTTKGAVLLPVVRMWSGTIALSFSPK